MFPPSRHVRLLAECVVRLPQRTDVMFVGSKLPNEDGEYEVMFAEEPSGQRETILVPVAMVCAAAESGNYTSLLAHLSSQYIMLFRRSLLPDGGPSHDNPVN